MLDDSEEHYCEEFLEKVKREPVHTRRSLRCGVDGGRLETAACERAARQGLSEALPESTNEKRTLG